MGAVDRSGGLYFDKVEIVGATGEALIGQNAMAASIPVALASDQGSVAVKGNGDGATVTLTVTNGAYSIGDAVGGLITFANAVSVNGKSAYLDSIVLTGAVALAYELWLFNADLATPAADNAAMALAAADFPKVLGVIPISAADWFTANAGYLAACVRGIGLKVKAAAGVTSIYGYLKATVTTSPALTTMYITPSWAHHN
jgi:hypothetical protein